MGIILSFGLCCFQLHLFDSHLFTEKKEGRIVLFSKKCASVSVLSVRLPTSVCPYLSEGQIILALYTNMFLFLPFLFTEINSHGYLLCQSFDNSLIIDLLSEVICP